MNNFINYLSILTFLVLYIICFVYLFDKKTELISFGMLSVFTGFFLLFVIQTCAIYINKSLNFIPLVGLFSIFTGTTFQLVSLILLLTMLYRMNVKYNVTSGTIVKLPKEYRKTMKQIKTLFIANQSGIVLLLFMLIFNFDVLNQDFYSKYSDFMKMGNITWFKPLVHPLFVMLISMAIIAGTTYEIYLSNFFSTLNSRYIGELYIKHNPSISSTESSGETSDNAYVSLQNKLYSKQDK